MQMFCIYRFILPHFFLLCTKFSLARRQVLWYAVDEVIEMKDERAVRRIIDALRKDGYTIACYTYGNLAYGETELEKLQTDLVRWQAEVEPLLGKVDMLVYAKESEISDYTGDRYLMLQNAGFKHFLGFSFDGKTYMDFAGEYVRQGRILITGNRLENKPDLYNGLFDPLAVQDPGR